jgi:hypothetical protein
MYSENANTERTTRRVSGQMTKRGGHMAVFRYVRVECPNPEAPSWVYWDMAPLDRADAPGTVRSW